MHTADMRLIPSWTLRKEVSIPPTSPRTDKANSDVSKSTSVAGSKDYISKLPIEILLAVIDALGDHHPHPLSPLRQLSLVSKPLNNVTNCRLWSSFVIGANRCRNGLPQTSSTKVQRSLKQRCHALTRDAARASLVHNLIIKVYAASCGLALMKDLYRVLLALVNLRSLRIEFQRGDEIPERSIKRLCTMLCETSSGDASRFFPFQLYEFACEAAMLELNPGVYPFLIGQTSIERLDVGRLKLGSFWRDPSMQSQKAYLGLGANRPGGVLLPSLCHFRGPSSYLGVIMRDQPFRKCQTLKSIHAIAQHTDVDLEHVQTWQSDTVHGTVMLPHRQPSHSGDHCHHPADDGCALGKVDTFALWTDGQHDGVDIDARLPELVAGAYGVDPRSIRSLKVGCGSACFNVHNALDDFPLSILTHFPALESLEWSSGGVSGAWGSASILQTKGRAVLIQFLQECERLVSGANLRRIAFSEREERLVELLRKRSLGHKDLSSIDESTMELQVLTPGQTAMPTGTALETQITSVGGQDVIHLASGSVWAILKGS